jgi:hypothetical protein
LFVEEDQKGCQPEDKAFNASIERKPFKSVIELCHRLPDRMMMRFSEIKYSPRLTADTYKIAT